MEYKEENKLDGESIDLKWKLFDGQLEGIAEGDDASVNPSTAAAPQTTGAHVEDSQPTKSLPSKLGIVFQSTDNTKSVVEEKTSSFRVKKDASLKLAFEVKKGEKDKKDKKDENGLSKGGPYFLKTWMNYKNQAYPHRVEVKDEELTNAGQLDSYSVFALSAGCKEITWQEDPNNNRAIIGQVNGFMMNDALFIKFRTFSSKVSKGKGWIFHCRLDDQSGKAVAAGCVDVTSVTIIRSPDKRGIKREHSMIQSPSAGSESSGGILKRKRQDSGYMTPSPAGSERGESSEEEGPDFSTKTWKELMAIFNKCDEVDMANRKRRNAVMEEIAKRNETS